MNWHPSTSASDESNSLKLYLQEIGEVPLLNAEEELVLARRIQKGDAEARTHMIRANLRLVVSMARKFSNRGLPIQDLISEGNMGLMHAVERFDPKRGARLSTYAGWWIKQSMRRAVANQSRMIRLPVHVGQKLGRIRKKTSELHNELERDPTDLELSHELGLSSRKLAHWKAAATAPTSLDAPVDSGEGTVFGDLLADVQTPDPAAAYRDKSRHAELSSLLKELNERERRVVEARFGLSGDKPQTLDVIGKTIKLTRERARQIQNEALKKMRECYMSWEMAGELRMANGA